MLYELKQNLELHMYLSISNWDGQVYSSQISNASVYLPNWATLKSAAAGQQTVG